MSCPIAQNVSSSECTACGVSAIIVPMPCVPCWSLTIAGQPPTRPSAASTPAGLRAQTVVGHVDVAPGEELEGAELVAAAGDGDGAVEHGHAHEIELAHHGQAVVGDAGADAGDDDVVTRDRRAPREQRGAPARDHDLELERVDDVDLVPRARAASTMRLVE